jgi:hypothetical protein
MTALARASRNYKRQAHPIVRKMLYKDYDRKCSIEKLVALSFKGLGTKTN